MAQLGPMHRNAIFKEQLCKQGCNVKVSIGRSVSGHMFLAEQRPVHRLMPDNWVMHKASFLATSLHIHVTIQVRSLADLFESRSSSSSDKCAGCRLQCAMMRTVRCMKWSRGWLRSLQRRRRSWCRIGYTPIGTATKIVGRRTHAIQPHNTLDSKKALHMSSVLLPDSQRGLKIFRNADSTSTLPHRPSSSKDRVVIVDARFGSVRSPVGVETKACSPEFVEMCPNGALSHAVCHIPSHLHDEY